MCAASARLAHVKYAGRATRRRQLDTDTPTCARGFPTATPPRRHQRRSESRNACGDPALLHRLRSPMPALLFTAATSESSKRRFGATQGMERPPPQGRGVVSMPWYENGKLPPVGHLRCYGKLPNDTPTTRHVHDECARRARDLHRTRNTATATRHGHANSCASPARRRAIDRTLVR
jgi:hypothetical protein